MQITHACDHDVARNGNRMQEFEALLNEQQPAKLADRTQITDEDIPF